MKNTKIFRYSVLVMAAILIASAVVLALAINPTISIVASPSTANTSSVITAIAVDLSGDGIAWTRIYEDGALKKQCSTATCVYVAVHTTPGTRSYYAVTSDNGQRTATSGTIKVNFTNAVPVLNAIGNKVVYEGDLLQFNISGYDYNNDPLTYSATGLPAGATFNPATKTFSWTPNSTSAGNYSATFSASDPFGSTSETIRITVLAKNNPLAPQYSNLAENPSSPATYASGQNYTFRIRWADSDGMSAVWIVFNGTAYAPSANGSDYTFVKNNLAAGSYNYIWYANDTLGNLNSVARTYVINKAIPALAIDISPSASEENGTETNASGSGCPSVLNCTLYRDGVVVSNPDVATLSVGTYVYVYNTTGNENYSSTSVSKMLSIWRQGSSSDNGNENKIIVIDDNDFKKGYSFYMNTGNKAKFSFCGAPYYIKLSDINWTDKEAYFILTPGSRTFVLEKNEKEELDLNGDGVNDALFRLNQITSDDRVKVYIEKLSDKCWIAKPESKETVEVYGEQTGVLEGKKASSITYVLFMLMVGIFLVALAILLYLLSKLRRKKPVQKITQ
jgi:hypothetical protein